ncbi:hypothetical protein PT974_10591 [Cladobotryum mycophilum]|uniref:PEBP-like protein n=1 Tax=Cladobotryum mycophilum TaxID=491253 RepID=A0ABR0SAC3_9HYPO
MAAARDYAERVFAWLFANAKAHDAKAFTTGPAFASCPEPTIAVSSPDCGASGATLGPAYMHAGEGLVPGLRWEGVEGVGEWLLVSEDPDAPLPTPICHGLYLGIHKDKLSVEQADFTPAEGGKSTHLEGGFYYGQNRLGNVYILPRPLLNHGIHRYFFDIIALNEPLSPELIASKPSKEQVAKAIQGKVLAWGRWVGECERKSG